MIKLPYSTIDVHRCRKCGKFKKKWRKQPSQVNPYDAGNPIEYCKCDDR
jgi:hypothetical protein